MVELQLALLVVPLPTLALLVARSMLASGSVGTFLVLFMVILACLVFLAYQWVVFLASL